MIGMQRVQFSEKALVEGSKKISTSMQMQCTLYLDLDNLKTPLTSLITGHTSNLVNGVLDSLFPGR